MNRALEPPVIRSRASEGVNCPICASSRHLYLFVIRGLPIVRCPDCGLIFTHPHPEESDFRTFYGDVLGEVDPRALWTDSDTERAAAGVCLRKLRYRGVTKGRLLLVAPPGHVIAMKAREEGYEVGQHVSIVEVEMGCRLNGEFDAALVYYQLEKSVRPTETLAMIHTSLKADGVLLVATPSLDSWSARYFGGQWTEWRPENRYYFSNTTVQLMLWRCGFERLEIAGDFRSYTAWHLYDRARAFPKTLLTKSIILLYRLFPPRLRGLRLRLPSSGIIVTAQRANKRPLALCSIVLPLYNERATFAVLMDALVAKQIPGMDKEIIVVESNSTDGSRELAMQYQGHPGVRTVFQGRPRGKGHAVREGLQHVRGDIILIQDADLEYDLNDYESLLEPLLNFRSAFVLGSRHGGSMKMRVFTDQPWLAAFVNVGQAFFVTLINVLYGQSMKDPFTMYKVFRRDCLHGLEFECNRFDFDHELVIKLVRKGYTPLELPVNYRSRSFKEGKKVRLIQDGLYGLWADLKYRFAPIGRRRPD